MIFVPLAFEWPSGAKISVPDSPVLALLTESWKSLQPLVSEPFLFLSFLSFELWVPVAPLAHLLDLSSENCPGCLFEPPSKRLQSLAVSLSLVLERTVQRSVVTVKPVWNSREVPLKS
jgi:hypothetical protein